MRSWVRRERHMSAPAGALWDAPAGNAREGEEGVGESPHVVGVVKSMAQTQKREGEHISLADYATGLQPLLLSAGPSP